MLGEISVCCGIPRKGQNRIHVSLVLQLDFGNPTTWVRIRQSPGPRARTGSLLILLIRGFYVVFGIITEEMRSTNRI